MKNGMRVCVCVGGCVPTCVFHYRSATQRTHFWNRSDLSLCVDRTESQPRRPDWECCLCQHPLMMNLTRLSNLWQPNRRKVISNYCFDWFCLVLVTSPSFLWPNSLIFLVFVHFAWGPCDWFGMILSIQDIKPLLQLIQMQNLKKTLCNHLYKALYLRILF